MNFPMQLPRRSMVVGRHFGWHIKACPRPRSFAERAIWQAGYRVYPPRYRKILTGHRRRSRAGFTCC